MAVGPGSQLYTGNIADPHQSALPVGTDDDILEVLYILEPSLGPQGKLELLILAYRLSADRPYGCLDILLPDGPDDVICGQALCRQFVRVHPDTDAVFLFPKDKGITDSLETDQGILDVVADIVAQKEHVTAALWRVEADDCHHIR